MSLYPTQIVHFSLHEKKKKQSSTNAKLTLSLIL